MSTDGTGPARTPLSFVTICWRCGELIDTLAVADAAASWQEPVLWGYLAQREHDPSCPRPTQHSP